MSEHRPGLQRGTPAYRRLLTALFFIGLATFAQLYSPQGLLPLIAVDLGVSADEAALMISAATLGVACGVIPWSYLGDRLGRKPAMIWAISLACFFAFSSPLMPTVELLLVSRFLEGLMLAGIPALAVAYLSEEVQPRDVVIAASIFVSGTTVGGLSGRIIAAPIGEVLGWQYGTLSVSVLAVGCVVIFIWLAPQATRFVPTPIRRPGALADLGSNLRSVPLIILYLQAFLSMGAFVAVYNYLGFYLGAPPFSLPLWLTSLAFLAYLAGTISSPPAGRLAVRWGRKRVLIIGNLVMVFGVALTTIPQLTAVLTGLVLATGGFFAAHAIASGWAGSAARGGRAQSASLYNLGYYAGSSLIGFLGGTFFALGGWPATAGFAGGCVLLAAGLVWWRLPMN